MEFLYPREKLSVPEIASRYQVSRQHVQVTTNALRERGLMTSTANPHHKRSSLMLLSDEGRDLFAQIRVREKETVAELFSGIPADDKETTRTTLETLMKRLSSGG